MKKDERKEIRQKSHKELMDMLNDLNLQKIKVETYLRLGGHQQPRVSYDSAIKHQANTNKKLPGNLRDIKRRIAFIKQVMHMKILKKGGI